MTTLVLIALAAVLAVATLVLRLRVPVPVGDTAAVRRAQLQASLAELARHSTAEDCWMAVEGKVYDATEYAPRHPAPPRVLLDWCGREATEAFRTKGVGRPHSRAAWAMLARMEVGVLTKGTGTPVN